jgi:inward rectifier potassium channel
MLRAGNERNNLILEASVRMSLVRKEITLEGQTFYRIHDMKLDRERSSAFALSWTIMHRIDENSPLYGKVAADLAAEEATLSVAISGLDETLNDTVHARNSYEPEQILFGSHFADILFERSTGRWAVDFTKFHDVEPDNSRRPK